MVMFAGSAVGQCGDGVCSGIASTIRVQSSQSIMFPDVERILDWRADSSHQTAARGFSIPESSACPDWDVSNDPHCFYWSRDYQEPGNPGVYYQSIAGCEVPESLCGFYGPGGVDVVETRFSYTGYRSILDRKFAGTVSETYSQELMPSSCAVLPPSRSASDSAAALCGSLIHTFVINTDVADPEAHILTVNNFTELEAAISGLFYPGSCTSPNGTVVVEPPDLFAYKEGRITTRIRIDGPPVSTSGQHYYREILIRNTIHAWGYSTGGTQTVGWDIEPTMAFSDTGAPNDPYVTYNEPSLEPYFPSDSPDIGTYCHYRRYRLSGPESSEHCDGSVVQSNNPLSVLCVRVGRPTVDYPAQNPGTETWTISINTQVSSQASYPNDIGGDGAPPNCSGLDCTLPGLIPDGKIDGSDLRLLEQSRGKTSADCGYIPKLDRDGNGVITNAEADSFLCASMVDYNADGFVDGFDYDDFVDDFQYGNCDADTNGDGFVDGFDYDFWVGMFETSLPDCPAGTTIPALGCNCR